MKEKVNSSTSSTPSALLSSSSSSSTSTSTSLSSFPMPPVSSSGSSSLVSARSRSAAKKIQQLKESKKNPKTAVGWPLIVLFSDDGSDVVQLNSVQGDWHGLYDNDSGYTYVEFSSSDPFSPSTDDPFMLHRYDTWFNIDRTPVYFVDWFNFLGHFMTVADGTGPSLVSSSCSSTTTTTTTTTTAITTPVVKKTTPRVHGHWELGNFKRPISEKRLKKRVGDDVPVPVFAIFDGDEYGFHKMSTPNMLYDIDFDSYHMSSSPVALTYLDIYYAIDIETFYEYYTYVVRVGNTCSVNGAVGFIIVAKGAAQTTCPLGRQLQASIPDQAVHQGVRCSGCGKSPIAGVRFQCCECKNLDLCSSCEEKQLTPYNHSVDHNMLKIKSPPVSRTAHTGVACNNCKVSPIEGIRYKCQICDDFDLCEKCERTTDHPSDHPLIKAKHLLK